MDRFRLRSRLRAWLLFAPALVLVAGSCGDDSVDTPEGERACARPLAWGHWADGSKHSIGTERHVCLCMTEAEYESGSRMDELNDMLLADCEQDAEPYDFDWTECPAYHDEGLWLEAVTWPTGPVDNRPGSQVVCAGG